MTEPVDAIRGNVRDFGPVASILLLIVLQQGGGLGGSGASGDEVLRSEIKHLTETVQTLNKNIDGLETQVNQMASNRAALTVTLTNMGSRITKLESREND